MTEYPLVLAKTKSGFDAALAAGEITEEQLVFIVETKEIWTWGTTFPCPYSKEELDQKVQDLVDSGNTLDEAIQAVVDRVVSLEEGKVDKEEGKSLVLDTEIDKLSELKSLEETNEVINGINTHIGEVEVNIDEIEENIDTIEQTASDLAAVVAQDITDLSDHKSDFDNPHQTTKAQVGLDKVQNLAPSEMPVSDATQEALDKKVDKVAGSSLVSDTEITKLAGLKSLTEITADIEAEKTRAEGAEESISKNLADEVAARLAGDNSLQQLIDGLTARLNALADSDDESLDQLSEIVAYIKSNKDLIDAITTSKVNVSDIIDNVTSTDTQKPLSANLGKVLKDLIDTLSGDLSTELDKKVDKETGKGLSTEDFTTDLKTKLLNIEEGALVNTVASVAGKTGDVTLVPTDVGLGNVTNDLLVKDADKGKANGVATLDDSTKVPIDQLPLVTSISDGAMTSADKVTLDDLDTRLDWIDLGGEDPGDTELSGPSSSRPTNVNIGFQYFDSTLGLPIWFNGANWVDSDGVIIDENYPPSVWNVVD